MAGGGVFGVAVAHAAGPADSVELAVLVDIPARVGFCGFMALLDTSSENEEKQAVPECTGGTQLLKPQSCARYLMLNLHLHNAIGYSRIILI